MRLADGKWKGEGRVEILYRGTWGTVCDDHWDQQDAQVVCRELGFVGALDAPVRARFGRGSGRIWLDDVQCIGTENSLKNCRHRGWGLHNCGHNEDASVVCSGMLMKMLSIIFFFVIHSFNVYVNVRYHAVLKAPLK